MSAGWGRHDGRCQPDAAGARAASLVTGVTLIVALGLLAAGVDWFWVAFPVGFGAVLPAAVAAARDRAEERSGTDEGDALATLRERYATGELDEAAFEARLERLLETEPGPDSVTAAAADPRERGYR
jgi:hypothetical protein